MGVGIRSGPKAVVLVVGAGGGGATTAMVLMMLMGERRVVAGTEEGSAVVEAGVDYLEVVGLRGLEGLGVDWLELEKERRTYAWKHMLVY